MSTKARTIRISMDSSFFIMTTGQRTGSNPPS
jgi:hypothetical protein